MFILFNFAIYYYKDENSESLNLNNYECTKEVISLIN